MPERPLANLRVFLVEDESLVAMLIEELLMELGCTVIGQAARLAAAGAALAKEKPDLALLDINVHGEPVYPLAETLERRHIPFVFVTGYAPGEIAAPFRHRPVLAKPFTLDTLAAVLRVALPQH